MINSIRIRSRWVSLKTGFLKWRPEYDIAADEYQKAGKKTRSYSI